MNRLIVALLAAFDALLAAAGGLVLALAPLTLLWVFGFGVEGDWGVLWPSAATLWQLGHLVPVTLALPETYLAAAGIDPAAAGFAISLAPLAFAVFTAAFAVRSGGRAAAAGDPITGVVGGALAFAAVATTAALTGSVAPVASVERWQGILFPALVYAVPLLVGAAVGAWVHDVAPVSRLRARVERMPGAWPLVPALVVRGTGLVGAGLVGVAAAVLGVAVIVRAPQIVALFEAGNVDVVGAIVLAVAQLLYLPTLIVWAMAFVIGPGFSLGEGSAVSPSGTQTGVVPGIPVLGVVPDSTSPWLLLLALLPVGVGVLAGWMLRARLAAVGLDDELAPRGVVTAGVSLVTAGVVALAAVCASGSIGPGRLSHVGPDPGPLALVVGLEVAVGAGILLLSPRRRNDAGSPADAESREGGPRPFVAAAPRPDVRAPAAPAADASALDSPAVAAPTPDDPAPEPPAADPDEQETAPIVGFERGSSRRPPPDGAPGASVD